MKVRAYYFVVADGNPEGMPIDGPFATPAAASDFAQTEYGVVAPYDWLPTTEAVNSLPEPIRLYVHDLEALSDPAGIVAENTLLRDQTRQLDAKIALMKRRLNCPLHHERRCVCGWVRGQN